MRARISEFVRTGRFGAIKPGDPSSLVVSGLGEPEDISEPRRVSGVWRYGNLQFGFERGRVEYIGLYFHSESLSKPGFLELDGGWPSDIPTEAAVKQFMLNLGIRWSINSPMTRNQQLTLETEGGTWIIIDAERRELDKIISARARYRGMK